MYIKFILNLLLLRIKNLDKYYKMNKVTLNEVMKRLIKYLIEGFVVALAAFVIPKKKLSVEDALWIAFVAGMTFSILDMFAPSIGMTARQGAGFGIGAGLVGFP